MLDYLKGLPTKDGKLKRGASSHTNPARIFSDPLSIITDYAVLSIINVFLFYNEL
jgi:hypothetical protein